MFIFEIISVKNRFLDSEIIYNYQWLIDFTTVEKSGIISKIMVIIRTKSVKIRKRKSNYFQGRNSKKINFALDILKFIDL